jgi:uncharacterized protein with von Willebrand factor type A (vWA) domain
MEERILKFISALRAGGVRISLAESADAFRAVDQMGVQDRQAFRLSLRATLVKEAKDIPTFEELFPLFFDSLNPPPLMNLIKDLTPEEARMLAQALRQFSEHLRQMLEKLLRGDKLSQQELDEFGQLVGLQHADDLRYREWMARRMEQALHFREVQEAVRELTQLLAQMGMSKERLEQLRHFLRSNQQVLQEQLRQYAGQRIAENMSERPRDEDIEGLLDRPFNALSDADMDRLRQEVRRLAAALRTRVALRQRRAKSGQLDAKATIRANLKHGNVPIELKHRDRKLKPKLVVVCDVSTSMRHCSELMLSLIHAMQDQISKTHAFAFIDHLEYISPDLAGQEPERAVMQVLDRMPPGYYNTDLGSSLETLAQDYADTVDSRTTFIVVGDGRNNYADPRLDMFRRLARRSHQTIWLTPEAPLLWGTGDSDMLKYAPLCDAILQVNTLSELTAAVDKLLIQK